VNDEQNQDPLEIQRKLELRIRFLVETNAPDEELQKVYDEFHLFLLEHRGRDKSTEDFLYKSALSPIDSLFLKRIGEGKSLVEIGLGDGCFLFNCARNGNSVSGIDISSVVVKRVQELFKREHLNGQIKLGEARKLAFPSKTFDLVVSKDLVEHLLEKDLPVHLSEVWRVLKENGCYLIWTPSILLGHTSMGGHMKEYNLSEMLQKLRSSGFKPVWLNLLFFRLFGLMQEISNSYVIQFLLGYEKILQKTFGTLGIQIRHPIIYLVVPPICVAGYKGKQ